MWFDAFNSKNAENAMKGIDASQLCFSSLSPFNYMELTNTGSILCIGRFARDKKKKISVLLIEDVLRELPDGITEGIQRKN